MDETQSTLHNLSDEALVPLAKAGDSEAMAELIGRMTPMVYGKASSFRKGKGAEFQDLTQEGMIGFLNALYAYDPAGGASFRTFADVCVANRLRNVVRTRPGMANTQTLSIETSGLPSSELGAPPQDPQDIITGKDQFSSLMKSLTVLEREVAFRFAAGESYDEIAAALSVTKKAVDNALQRIRKKLKNSL